MSVERVSDNGGYSRTFTVEDRDGNRGRVMAWRDGVVVVHITDDDGRELRLELGRDDLKEVLLGLKDKMAGDLV